MFRYLGVVLFLISSVAGSMVDDLEGEKGELDCKFHCTREWMPVCAKYLEKNEFLLFENACTMELYSCLHGLKFTKASMEECNNSMSAEYHDDGHFVITDPKQNESVDDMQVAKDTGNADEMMMVIEFLPRKVKTNW